jgi:hypothetical protein
MLTNHSADNKYFNTSNYGENCPLIIDKADQITDDETGVNSSTVGDTGSGSLGRGHCEDPSVHGKIILKGS